jgi:hypothetical protein
MFDMAMPDTLVREVEECHRGESRLIARRMAAVAALLVYRTGEAEDAPSADPGYALITGFARTAAEVAAAMNLAPLTASTMVGHAEVLDTRLPAVAGLLAEGRIDWQTAHLVITRTELVDGAVMAGLDREIADRIASWSSWSRRRVINAVDAAVARLDPEAVKERRVAADTARHVSVTAQPNGNAALRGSLPAPAAVVVDKRLTEIATATCPQDPRTLDQRRADALLALAEGHALACQCARTDCPNRLDPEAQSRSRFVINVVADQATVSGASDAPGYLDGYGVIDADRVRGLTDTAPLRLVSEPAVSDAEAMRHQPSAAMERWIRSRDLTCRFPGCTRSAWIADIDHTVPFDHANPGAGGRTVLGNTKCYCREHHRLKTFHGGPDGWRDVQLPDGTVVLASPTGRIYRTTPEGADLFPGLRPACVEPVPRRRSRRREKACRTARARQVLHAQRSINTETRRLNRARAHEIELRRWRNTMRRALLVLKGGHPSTSPWCGWVNDPLENEHITADWHPPPPPISTFDDDEPPF